MHKHHIVTAIFILSLSINVNAYAAEIHYYATYHAKYGDKLLKSGKVDQAINQFVKSILYQPSQAISQDRLKRILRDPDLIFNEEKIILLRFVELVEYANFLEEQKNKLIASNDLYVEFLNEYSTLDARIEREVIDLKNKFMSIEILPIAPSTMMLPIEMAGNIDMNKFISKFNNRRQKLSAQVKKLQNINAQFSLLKVKVIQKLGLLKKKEFKESFENKINGITTQLNEKEEILVKQKDEIAFFNAQLENVKKEFALIQDELKLNDKKLNQLNQKLASSSLDLYEKNRVIAEKNDNLKQLEKNLHESTEKLSLIRRIIQEKDLKIAHLENNLKNSSHHKAQESTMRSKMSALREDVATLNQDLKNQAQQHQLKISTLQNQMSALKKKNSDLEQELDAAGLNYSYLKDNLAIKESKIISLRKEKDLEVFKLRAIIKSRDERLKHYNNKLLVKEGKLNELKNVIVIYRDKFNNSQQLLKEKQKKLEEIEEQYIIINEKIDRTTMRQPIKGLPQKFPHSSKLISLHKLSDK